MLRKFNKLRKNPRLFLYDAVRKRVPESLLGTHASREARELTITADGYDVVNELAIISHPGIVEVLQDLKKKNAKITISW